MATNTYVALATNTVTGSPVSSITFDLSSISGYTDLEIKAAILPSVSTNQPYIQFNADTGTGTTNYSTTSLRGDGSSGASSRHTNQYGWFPVPGPGVGTNGNPEPWLVSVMNYSNTTTFKTGLSRFNNASSIVSANAHLWRSTAAITSITITMESGNFNVGSTFSLYGIAAETALVAKATGGTISYGADGYIYHAFTSGGTFTTTQALTCDVLSVGGGGGGGWNNAGGGGGGEVDILSSLSIDSGVSKTVTIGGGGATATSTASAGANGVTTTFAGDTSSLGGGGGGTGDATGGQQSGQAGGSGGGGGLSSGGGAASGSNTNIGGTGYASGAGGGQYAGGGGGGATSAGGNANIGTLISGAGGQGYALANIFSGLTLSGITHFGSGGSGGVYNGTRALGGTNAGNGAQDSGSDLQPTTPTANAGGGGGGGAYIGVNSRQGSNGASGIVIVRYEG